MTRLKMPTSATATERLAARSEPQPNGCILWTGSVQSNGYGRIGYQGKSLYVHRLAYETHVGPIPDGMTIDHVKDRGCIHKNCINPRHLEPVTRPENTIRGNYLGGFCKRGHEVVGANVVNGSGGKNACRTCRDARNALRYAATAEQVPA